MEVVEIFLGVMAGLLIGYWIVLKGEDDD